MASRPKSRPDFAQLFEAMPGQYMVLDRDLVYVEANAAYCASTERSRDEIIGRYVFEAFPPTGEGGRLIEESIRRVLATGVAETVPLAAYPIPTPTGGFRMKYWSCAHLPLFDEQGQVAFVAQNAVDVTELQDLKTLVFGPDPGAPARGENDLFHRTLEITAANESLAAEMRGLRDLFMQAPGFMAVLTGPDLVYAQANNAYLKLIGHRPVVGLPLAKALPEVVEQGFDRLLLSVMRDKTPHIGQGTRVMLQRRPHAPPEERFLDFIFQPIVGPDGNSVGVFVEGSDVTDRILAERRREALHELDARLRQTENVEELAYQSAELLGATLGVSRAGYGAVDHEQATITIDRAWNLPGRADVVGVHDFSNYGSYIDELRSGQAVMVCDVESDDRTKGQANSFRQLGIRAFLDAPVVEDGKVVAEVFVHSEAVRVWTNEDRLLATEFATRTRAAIARRKAEAALSKSEARYRTALEIRTVGAITFDLEGRLLDANNAFLAMSGYDRVDLEAGRLSLQSLTAPEWQDTVVRTLSELQAGGETTPVQKEYVRRDGSRWWGLFAAKRLEGGVGFKFIVDISEQKRAEVALREQTAALEALNRAAAITAVERDLDRVVQAVTDTGVELTGAEFGAFFYNVIGTEGESYMLYTLSGVPREAFSSFPMPRNTDVFAPTFGGEGIIRSDDIKLDPRYGRNKPHRGMPDGHLPVASYLAVPVASRGGEVIGGLFFGHSASGRFTADHEHRIVGLAAQAAVAIDNARLFKEVQSANATLEQRVAERSRELSEAHEALRQAQKMEAVGQLTGGIAHDFNNLLMGIHGSLDMIERGLAKRGIDGFERYMQGAQSSARRASSLTQRLLAFSRRQTLDPKPTDINRLIYGVEDLLRRTVGPSIEVEVVGQGGLWPARIDASQLESALLNLAINARDAMPEGGRITIETANKWLDDRGAKERELTPGQYLSICVTDTGVGIPKDIIDRIFDPFFTTKPTGEGTGLGLSMVHGFVRQSGGQIRVYSEEGKGTTICLYLPRHTGDVPMEAPAETTISEFGSGETVLIIDDEPTVRMLMKDVLTEAGYSVLEAQDGPSGMRVLETEIGIDLLITDVGLPGGMNGRQVADAARATRPDLKVLFVTGFAENAAVGNGHLPAGMAVLTKPFQVADLATKVRSIIDDLTV